jgi:hypothetical protein
VEQEEQLHYKALTVAILCSALLHQMVAVVVVALLM